jgi:hypothetical protein
MIYVLLLLCIALAGIAGLMFAYLVFMDISNKQQKHRIAELERELRKYSIIKDEAANPSEGPQPSAVENWPEFVDVDKTR